MNFARELRIKWPHLYRKCTIGRFVAIIVICAVLNNEYLSYILKSWRWSSLQIDSSHAAQQLRVLFVADPQLIGLQDELQAVGPLSRWDSDRFMRRTFRQAYWHVRPDVVVFLGDLLDEGSKASEEEYHSYMERFHDIFYTPPNVKHIYIAGDNDVGGEGMDFKMQHKVDRFHKFFLKMNSGEDDALTTVKFLDFVNLELDYGSTWDGQNRRRIEGAVEQYGGSFPVLLNHMNLLDKDITYYQPVLKATKASIIFTAHTHISKLYTCLDCLEDNPSIAGRRFAWKGSTKVLSDYAVHTFNLRDKLAISEVVIPTCSYRMGVPAMGYGAAIFDENGAVSFTVLWTPSRYFQLYSYIYILYAVGLLLLFIFVRNVCCVHFCTRFHKLSKSREPLPLAYVPPI